MDSECSAITFGDIISLCTFNDMPNNATIKNGHLTSLGLVDDRCAVRQQYERLTCHPDKFSDCLFKIHPQLKYVSQFQYERAERNTSKKKISSIVEVSFHVKWQKAAQLEQEQNNKQITKDTGEPVKYGDVVQLQHLKSGKFLTINKQQAALVEKPAMRVSLDSKGSENCWITLEPIYKMKSTGDEILNEDRVKIVGFHAQHPLHISDKFLHDYPKHFEVNSMASSCSKSWQIFLFMGHADDKEDILKGGSVVRLFHSEQEKFLTCDPEGEGNTEKISDHEKVNGHCAFLRHTQRSNPSDATSSKAMWEVQLVHVGNPFLSGAAKWNESLVRFKHLASGEYLTVSPLVNACNRDTYMPRRPSVDHIIPVFLPKAHDQTEFVLTIGVKFPPYLYNMLSLRVNSRANSVPDIDQNEDFTLFQIFPTKNQEDEYIHTKAYIKLFHLATKSWVKTTGLYLFGNNIVVGVSKMKEDTEAFALMFVPTQEVRDLDFATDAAKMIGKVAVKWESLTHTEIKLITGLLENLVLFLCIKEDDNIDALKVDLTPSEKVNRRQKLIREQSILKEVFLLLKSPYDFDSEKRAVKKHLIEKKFEGSIHLFKLCYRLIRHSFDGYRKNQEHIAGEFFWFMQQQLGQGVNAEETMAYLVKQNTKVLDKYMGDKQIQLFLDLLLEHKHPRYLQHLCELCVMKNSDVSVSRTVQGLIQKILLNQYHQNVLITINQDVEDVDDDDDIYLSVPWNEELDKLGQKMLCYLMTRNDYVYNKLFEYWKYQLELYAAICYDRHYQAIDHKFLKHQLPVSLVIGCMKDGDLPLSLRAAYCKLLQTMYLNVTPQNPVTPIDYARLWHDIPTTINDSLFNSKMTLKAEDPRPQCDIEINKEERDVFIYLKDTIDFIKTELSQESCVMGLILEKDQFIYELVKTASLLVKFGFYRFNRLLELAEILLNLVEKNLMDTDSAHAEQEITKEMNEQNEVIMTTKLEILKILEFIMNLRLDIRLSIILVLFKSKYENPDETIDDDIHHMNIITQVDGYFRNDSQEKLCLDNESGKKLVRVLIYFITMGCNLVDSRSKLYKSIKEDALRLLFRHFNQRKEFVCSFKQIQMLVAEPDKDDYMTIKDGVEALKKYLDGKSSGQPEGEIVVRPRSGTTRGTLPRSKTLKKPTLEDYAACPEEVLHDLSDLCNEKNVRRNHVQRLLRNLGAHKSIINIIEVATKEKNSDRGQLIVWSHKFLQRFCRANTTNQHLLFQDIKLLMNTDNSEEEAKTLQAIFEDNEEICSRFVTEDILQKFISAIEKDTTPNLVYINLFQTLVKIKINQEEKCIPRNQDLVINALTASDEALQPYADDKLRKILEDYLYTHNEEIIKSYHYHIAVIKLLALCVEGNEYTKHKCHALISLEDLAKVICNHNITNAEVKKEYTNLLLHAYVFSDSDLISKQTMWNILSQYIFDIAMVSKHFDGANSESHEKNRKDYVLLTIIPLITAFFQNSSSSIRRLTQPKSCEIFVQLIQHVAQLLGAKHLYSDFKEDIWHKVSSCLDDLLKIAKDWNVPLPSELEGVVSQSKQHVTQLMYARRILRTTSKFGPLIIKSRSNFGKNEDIEVKIANMTEKLEGEMNPLIDADTFVLVSCLIHPELLFPEHINLYKQLISDKRHITALIDIAESCFDTNEGLCIQILITLRKYIETPSIGDINENETEGVSEDDKRRMLEMHKLANEQCAIYLISRKIQIRKFSAGQKSYSNLEVGREDHSIIDKLFTYKYDLNSNNHIDMIRERQNTLDSFRVSHLVINLMKKCLKKGSLRIQIFFEALKLGIALLNGGNAEVQDTLYKYFQKDVFEFFNAINICMTNAQLELKSTIGTSLGQNETYARQKNIVEYASKSSSSVLTELGCMLNILRFLQLLCENHNRLLQNFLRETQINLVKETILFLESICGGTSAGLGLVSAYINQYNEELVIQCLNTLTEYCQGPCHDNQDCLALTENQTIDIVMGIITGEFDTPNKLELKKTSVNTLLSIMESRVDSEISDKIMKGLKKDNLIKMIYDINTLAEDVYNSNTDEKEKETKITSLEETGHSLYILAHLLSQHHKPLAEQLKKEYDDDVRKHTDKNNITKLPKFKIAYFAENTSSIEIVRQDHEKVRLERIIFPKPPISSYLDNQTKESFLKSAEADVKGSRVKYFFDRFDDLYNIMENKERLTKSNWKNYITLFINYWSSLKFSFAVIINLILFLYYPYQETDLDLWALCFLWLLFGSYLVASKYWHKTRGGSAGKLRFCFCILSFIAISLMMTIGMLNMKYVLFLLGLGQLIIVTIFFLSYLGSHGGLYWHQIFREDSPFLKHLSAWNLKIEFYYHCSYIVVCLLGFTIHPFFYSLLLLDLVYREETLQNVMKSVTKNWFSIMLTFLLTIVLIYIFSIVGYMLFKYDFWVAYDPPGCANSSETECDEPDRTEPTCETLFQCVLTTLWQGLRTGGGIGDILRKPSKEDRNHYYLRIIYDMSFFFGISVITLNLILGVIVDTFANLRNIQTDQEDILKNSCFICGLKRSDFDKIGMKFEDHIKKEHNVWHYLQFRAYLKNKSRTEYTGPESYVQNEIDNGSIEWFPWLRAMSLKNTDEDDEMEQTEFEAIKNILAQLTDNMTILQERCLNIEHKMVPGTLNRQPTVRRGKTTKSLIMGSLTRQQSQYS